MYHIANKLLLGEGTGGYMQIVPVYQTKILKWYGKRYAENLINTGVKGISTLCTHSFEERVIIGIIGNTRNTPNAPDTPIYAYIGAWHNLGTAKIRQEGNDGGFKK